jgi:DNA-binding GntR family transcriptional regulator
MLRYRVESLYVSENGLRAVSGHRRVLECLAKKDNIGIEAAIRDHLEQSKRDIHRFAFEMKTCTNIEGD